MTSKNNSATAVSDVLLTGPAEKPSGSKSLSTARPLATQQYLYFTETNTDRILDNLDGLRDMVFPRAPHLEVDGESRNEQEFPSGCLIGLGRCGSNIALDVAELVYNARKFYLNEFSNEDKSTGQGLQPGPVDPQQPAPGQRQGQQTGVPGGTAGNAWRPGQGHRRAYPLLAQGRKKRLFARLQQDENHGPV